MTTGDTFLNDRYRLIAQQGSGGMAVIYKAVDERLGRTVAIKILRPSLTADPAFITRFQNEARSIANLSHPNIVTVHDVDNEGPTNYIVMEFVEGQDLKKVIRAHGALPIERALHFAVGICAGLGFAHRAGLVHADVKPQNVLINRDDVVKITDFGIAQAWSDTQPQQRQSVVWGSPHYFAPEQAQGERPTAASDVYSIGIVMFEMLTGRLPFSGTNQQELALAHIREPIPSVSEFNPAIPEPLAQIIAKVMSKQPHDRYRTADQLGRVLIAYRDNARGQTVSSPRPNDEREDEPTNPLSQQRRQETPPPANEQQPESPAQSPYAHRYPSGGPQEALPTQRYSAAPDAPNLPKPPDNAASSAVPSPQQNQYGNLRGMPPPQVRPDSQRYQAYEQDESGSVFDGVTIALAVLALMSVACLIPLYIVVLQARL